MDDKCSPGTDQHHMRIPIRGDGLQAGREPRQGDVRRQDAEEGTGRILEGQRIGRHLPVSASFVEIGFAPDRLVVKPGDPVPVEGRIVVIGIAHLDRPYLFRFLVDVRIGREPVGTLEIVGFKGNCTADDARIGEDQLAGGLVHKALPVAVALDEPVHVVDGPLHFGDHLLDVADDQVDLLPGHFHRHLLDEPVGDEAEQHGDGHQDAR